MHPATKAILRYFDFEHLPEPLRQVSAPFHATAHAMAERHVELARAGAVDPDSGAELTAGLRKLLEAKDCCVRAFLPPR